MDREALLKARLTERTVPIDGVGEMRVRGLSRAEVMHLKDYVGREDEGEVWMLARTIVDPALSEDDVRVWRDVASAGEVEAVVQAVSDLSGLGRTVAEAVRHFQEGQGSAVGVHGGGPAQDDGRPAT